MTVKWQAGDVGRTGTGAYFLVIGRAGEECGIVWLSSSNVGLYELRLGMHSVSEDYVQASSYIGNIHNELYGLVKEIDKL